MILYDIYHTSGNRYFIYFRTRTVTTYVYVAIYVQTIQLSDVLMTPVTLQTKRPRGARTVSR